MSVTSGFFDYKLVDNVPDRSYNSDELSRIFDGIITPGVFMHVGNKLEVVAGEGMTIRVRSGRCWFNNKWVNNDADLPLNIGGTTAAGRKDAVVVELNLNTSDNEGRWAYIKVIPGTETAIQPLVNTATLKQYLLATVSVPPNTTTSIIQDMIIPNVGRGGDNPVEWIGTPLTGFSAEYYYTHWQSEFDNWFGNAPLNNGVKQAWSTWFTNTQNAWTTWLTNTQSAWSTWFSDTQAAWTAWFNATKDAWTTWHAGIQSDWTTWFNGVKTEWTAYLAAKDVEWAAWLSDRLASFTTWFNGVKGQITGDLGSKLALATLTYVNTTLNISGWSPVTVQGEIEYYSYTINVETLTQDARVDISLNLAPSDYDDAETYLKNYSYIYSGGFSNDLRTIYLYAVSKPTVNIPVQIGGISLRS